MLRTVFKAAPAGAAAAASAANSVNIPKADAGVRRPPPAKLETKTGLKVEEDWETVDYQDYLGDIQQHEREDAFSLAQQYVDNLQEKHEQNTGRLTVEPEFQLEIKPGDNSALQSTPVRSGDASTDDSEIDDVLILGTGQTAVVMETAELNMTRDGRRDLRNRGAPSDLNFYQDRYFKAVNASLSDPNIIAAFMNNPEVKVMMNEYRADRQVALPPSFGALPLIRGPDEQKCPEGQNGLEIFFKDIAGNVHSAVVAIQKTAQKFLQNLGRTLRGLMGQKSKPHSAKDPNHIGVFLSTRGEDGEVKLALVLPGQSNKAENETDTHDMDDDGSAFLQAVVAGTFMILCIVLFKRMSVRTPLRPL